jgi:hypothetical protein
MFENEIVEVIKRRQGRYKTQRGSGSQEYLDEASRLIGEEYDALLAEIAALGVSRATETANKQANEQSDKAAHAQILGDQGQSGG